MSLNVPSPISPLAPSVRAAVADCPVRKRLNHRGPLSLDTSSFWYFVTVCAAVRCVSGRGGCATAVRQGLVVPDTPLMTHAMDVLAAARFRHGCGMWRLSLFLVMPDHLHMIVRFPSARNEMERTVADAKRWLSAAYGLRFQRGFFETRLRNDAHHAEKFCYICRNPVRKGLCASARVWPFVISFDRTTGEERVHR